jgi:hypothetical protein
MTLPFRVFFHAVASTASCLFQRQRECPRTILRSLCVAAFDCAARAGGQPLRPEQHKAMACLLDLGALINDHFDQHHFCKNSYRKLRRLIAVNTTTIAIYRVYFRELRLAERNRPRLQLSCHCRILQEIADYRESVVRLSLSALAAIAFDSKNAIKAEKTQKQAANEACLPHLFALAMLIQICDDLLDWRRDWLSGIPSFVTAELLQCDGATDRDASRRIRRNIETAAAAYLAAIPKRRTVFWPFLPCAYAAFFLVKLFGIFTMRRCDAHDRNRLRQMCCPPSNDYIH